MLPNILDQLEDIVGRSGAIIDYKIPMFGRDESPAHPGAFQAEFVDELAGWDAGRIFEYTTGTRRGRLRTPTLLAEFFHAPLNQFARSGLAVQNGSERDVRLEGGAVTIVDIKLLAGPFKHVSVEINEADRLDQVEYCTPHCASIHSQAATD